MTIRHLRIFIKVAECKKMNQAAKELFISQPSVSQAIAELENYYGMLLFERLNQKLHITAFGQELLPYARKVIESFDSLEMAMKHVKEQPIIKMGASVSVGTCLLNDIIDKAEEEMQDVVFHVDINNTKSIEKQLLEGQIDIAIVEGLVTNKELIQIPLCEDELVVVAGKNHPYFKRSEISLAELQREKLIAREDASNERNQYELFLLQNGIELDRQWNCTNTEAIKNAVKKRKNIAILSKLLIEKEVEEGSLKIISVKGVKITRTLHLLYHKNKYISKPLQNLIDISISQLKAKS